MSTNKAGKVFEKNLKLEAQKQGLWTFRINDSDLSFCNGNSKFTPKNIGDFLFFHCEKKILFLVECKSTKYKNLSFDREDGDNKMIKLHQIKSLTENNQYDNIESIFLFNFRQEDALGNILDENTYIMSINDFNDFYCETEKSSINKEDIVAHNGVMISQKMKRKFFTYEIKEGLEKFLELKGG